MEYRKPTAARIGSAARTAQLYRLEEKAHAATEAATNELGKILGFTEEQFYTHSLPEALFTILDSWDLIASILAATTFLERYGYRVEVGPDVPGSWPRGSATCASE